MRADARRNRTAVLDAGARLLAEHPTASMQEIAAASGVGRTTVYRHFPAREDLVAALVQQVVSEVAAVSDAVLATDGPAVDVLRRLAAEYVSLGQRWSFLRSQREEVLASVGGTDRRFLEWFGVMQARGELRDDFSPTWIQAATRAVVDAGIEHARTTGPEVAGRLAGETLVSALGPR